MSDPATSADRRGARQHPPHRKKNYSGAFGGSSFRVVRMRRRLSRPLFKTDSVGSDGQEKNTLSSLNLKGDETGRDHWAPLVIYLGPCFAEKKINFGMPMEHISFDENSNLYESISLDCAIQVWCSNAHQGTLKELRQKLIYGESMLSRLLSENCAEQRIFSLYFAQKITKKQLKEQLLELFDDEELYDALVEALRKMTRERIFCKLNPTIKIFVPEAQLTANIASKKKLKWALKYNPEIISFDEGNLRFDKYDAEEALLFASKYKRKVRIASWGNEIPDVPLSELIFRSLTNYLRTGRFTDCRHIALTFSYAESQVLNAVQQQTSGEDFAFKLGYVLDDEGFVRKSVGPTAHATPAAPANSTQCIGLSSGKGNPATAASSPRIASVLVGSVFSRCYLCQDNDAAYVNVPTTKARASCKKELYVPPVRRRSSLLNNLSRRSNNESPALQAEYQAIARQIQLEVGYVDPIQWDSSNPVQSIEDNIAAVAARNSMRKRVATDWSVFLNYSLENFNSAKKRVIARSYSMGGANNSQFSLLRRENSSSTTNSQLSSKLSMFASKKNIQDLPDCGENGSYTYGLTSDNVGSANSEPMFNGISAADVKACKSTRKASGAVSSARTARVHSSLEDTILIKRISCHNLLTVARTHATSLTEGDIEIPQFPVRLEAKSSESSASRSYGESVRSEEQDEDRTEARSIEAIYEQEPDNKTIASHDIKKSKLTNETESADTVDEDDQGDEFGELSTANSSLKITATDSKRWSGLSSNASSILFEFLKSDSAEQPSLLPTHVLRPNLYINTATGSDDSVSPVETPVVPSSRAQEALLSFSADSTDTDEQRSQKDKQLNIVLYGNREGTDLRCTTLSTLSGSPHMRESFELKPLGLSSLSGEQLQALSECPVPAGRDRERSISSGVSDQRTYEAPYMPVLEEITENSSVKQTGSINNDSTTVFNAQFSDGPINTSERRDTSSITSEQVLNSSDVKVAASISSTFVANETKSIKSATVVVARRKGATPNLPTPPGGSMTPPSPVPSPKISAGYKFDSKGSDVEDNIKVNKSNGVKTVPTGDNLCAQEAALRAAQQDAVNAKLAALKAQRVAREIKRMRTAVFNPGFAAPQSSLATRTDSQNSMEDEAINLERNPLKYIAKLPSVRVEPTSPQEPLSGFDNDSDDDSGEVPLNTSPKNQSTSNPQAVQPAASMAMYGEVGIDVGSVKVKAAEIEKRVIKCSELLKKYSLRKLNSTSNSNMQVYQAEEKHEKMI